MARIYALPKNARAKFIGQANSEMEYMREIPPRIKFAVIGINHAHIYSLMDKIIKSGGVVVSFYAIAADLVADFTKRYPQVKVAQSDKAILEDNSIQLIVSAAIPDERASIGIAAMLHGKDFMVDKPGVTTLKQLNPHGS